MYKDKLGRVLEVGQRVAYATTFGRSATLKVGTVTALNTSTVTIMADNGYNPSHISNIHNIIIL